MFVYAKYSDWNKHIILCTPDQLAQDMHEQTTINDTFAQKIACSVHGKTGAGGGSELRNYARATEGR